MNCVIDSVMLTQPAQSRPRPRPSRNANLAIYAARNVSSRRSYVLLLVFLFFFSPRDLRAASADRRETLPRDRKVLAHHNLGPRILGALPKIVGGQKRAKLTSSSANFKLRLRISPERMEISKIGKTCDRQRFLPRSAKKSG